MQSRGWTAFVGALGVLAAAATAHAYGDLTSGAIDGGVVEGTPSPPLAVELVDPPVVARQNGSAAALASLDLVAAAGPSGPSGPGPSGPSGPGPSGPGPSGPPAGPSGPAPG